MKEECDIKMHTMKKISELLVTVILDFIVLPNLQIVFGSKEQVSLIGKTEHFNRISLLVHYI